MTFVPTNLANSPSSFFEPKLNITTNDNIFSYNSSAPFTAFQIKSQTLATFFQVFQQKSNDVLTSLGSWFFTQTKEQNSMSCAEKLIAGSALAVLTSNPLPAFFGAFGCLNTITAAKAPFSSLQKFLDTVNDITKKITNLSIAYSGVSVTKKIADGGGYNEGSNDYFSHVLKAISNVAGDIQTILSPFESLIIVIRDAFAEEALSRFATLAELIQINNEINSIRTAIGQLETSLSNIHNSNIAKISELKELLLLDFLQNNLNDFTNQLNGNYQRIEELKDGINKADLKVKSFTSSKLQQENRLATLYDLMENHPQFYDEIAIRILRLEDNINVLEGNIASWQNYIDGCNQEIAKQNRLIQEANQIIIDQRSIITQRQTFFNEFKKVESSLAHNYQTTLKAKIKELKDLAEAKYAHLRTKLDQANAKLNHKTKEEL